MIKNYDKFLNENTDTNNFRIYISHFSISTIIFDKDFVIDEIIHDKLDIIPYSIVNFYSKNLNMNDYWKFIWKIYIENFKAQTLNVLKRLNLGIKDVDVVPCEHNDIDKRGAQYKDVVIPQKI